MKQVKGLWFLGCGLTMLVVWGYLWWRVWSSPIAPGEPPLDSFLMGLLMALLSPVAAVGIALHPTNIVFSLYALTMFALIAIGLFRLVWSLFHIWDDEEEE
jgi:hypothetical protein